MQLLAVARALETLRDTFHSEHLPCESMYLSGSIARNEADEGSDVDVVIIPPQWQIDGRSQAERLAAVLERATRAAQAELAASGSALKFSVPKVACYSDWEANHWLYPVGYGLQAIDAPTLDGSDNHTRLVLPSGRVFDHDTHALLASRLVKVLGKISGNTLRNRAPTYRIRMKFIAGFLRLAIFLQTGVYLKRFDSVLAVAGMTYGRPCSTLARQSVESPDPSAVLTQTDLLALGEQLIEIFRSVAPPLKGHSASLTVEMPPALWRPLLTESTSHSVPQALATVQTRVDRFDGLCVLTPDRPSAWSETLLSMAQAACADLPRLFIIPAGAFQHFMSLDHPLEVWQWLSSPSSRQLATALGLSSNSQTLRLGALRTLGYFRYNSFNKWIDLKSSGCPSAETLEWRLQLLLPSLHALERLGLSSHPPLETVRGLLRDLCQPDGVQKAMDSWLSLAHELPSVADLLTASMREALDGGTDFDLS